MTRALGAVLAAVLSGCLTPLAALTQRTPLVAEEMRFVIASDGAEDREVERLAAALSRATAPLKRWGGLREPVTLYLLPTHQALEQATRRPDHAWLQAWASYDEVLVESPRRWARADADLEQLVVHELSHCLLFQRSAERERWTSLQIPLWFREGLALWTAGQGERLPGLEDLARWLGAHQQDDAFADGERLSKHAYEPIYGLAYQAFAYLLRRFGAESVPALMARMRGGLDFPPAFESVYGLRPLQFQHDFERWLRRDLQRGRSMTGRTWVMLAERTGRRDGMTASTEAPN